MHLQMYLYLIGWRGGQVFPSVEELKTPPSDGIYKTALGRDVFDDKLKSIAKAIFLPLRIDRFRLTNVPDQEDGVIHSTRKRNFPTWGTHSCRKTGYLFAIWGGGNMQDIMSCARHKKQETALKYAQDSKYDMLM